MASSVLDAVVGVDASGVVLEWNRAAEHLFGWSRSEALGRKLDELIIPAVYRDRHNEGMTRVQETGVSQILNRRVEVSALARDGRIFPVELSIVPLEGAGGRIFVGFLRDISERISAQERLSLSEESLRLATDAAEIGTWDLDVPRGVLSWSPRTRAMFGKSPDAPCSLDDFYAGLHPDDREAVTQLFSRALDPAIRATYDVQYRTVGAEDGLIRWVAAKGRALFDDQGRCIRAVGVAMDITARKLEDARHAFMLQLSDVLRGGDTHKAMTAACALMGEHFAVARVGYGQLDPVEDVFDYSICWTDGRVPELLGRHPAHALGSKIVAQLGRGETVVIADLQSDPLSDEEETRATARAVETRAILVVPFVRAGRLRTIVYLNDRRIRHWRPDEIAFMEEVAERTRQVFERGEAEAALRELNATLEARVLERTAELRATEEALRQAQKMEAIGQLTGGIAHDFNNLLQGITGSLTVVSKRIRQGRTQDLERFIDGATTSAQKAAALVHRLLAFARRQPLDARAVAPNVLVGSMEDLLRRTLGENVRLETRLCESAWTVRCDPNQLESAILNLTINARDAMPDGGTLTVATRNVEFEIMPDGLDLTPGRYLCISVSDTGAGMDASTIARAFEPFFTTKPIGQGTGLGLSMIYGFARQSGGDVKIASTPGEGTTMDLFLPHYASLLEDSGRPVEEPSSYAQAASGTVLVVEDDAIVRSLVLEVLADLGLSALEADDGPGGLSILRSDQPVDLLISDVGLPGLNGRQLADAARAVRPELKVLFMTGYAETTVTNNFLERGMSLIAKPFAIDTFAAQVRDLLSER
ncbi:PAS domain S-box protein [Alsobacter sp. KACC 23698]|uniref:histidine kinase n=1 Tax=Alsobacter sp. KACC 23698 TaxID=3149229 RepID=A0AAU7JG40_9HYPH